MNPLREYFQQRRIERYQETVARIRELRAALNGIDYEIHPFYWEETAADLQSQITKAEHAFSKLDTDLKLH